MDPLIVPIVTEMQRRHRLHLVFYAWKAGQQIKRQERGKLQLLMACVYPRAYDHHQHPCHWLQENLEPDMEGHMEADSVFVRNCLGPFRAAGERVAFEAMRCLKKRQEAMSDPNLLQIFDTIEPELWQRVFAESFL